MMEKTFSRNSPPQTKGSLGLMKVLPYLLWALMMVAMLLGFF